MFLYVPWEEKFMMPDRGLISRHHDLILDGATNTYIGEFFDGIPYVGYFKSVPTFIKEFNIYINFSNTRFIHFVSYYGKITIIIKII